MTTHLVVIGGQRCGSTYLTSILDAHPDVAMARPFRPEPKVFLSDEDVDRGLEWYHRTYFRHASPEQVLGEKSTSYLEDPRAPQRVARMLGRPHVLAVLRDPVERAVSNWRFSTDNGFETRPLEEALRANLDRPEPWDSSRTSVSPFAYLERGRYADLLQPWLAVFPDTTSVFFLADLVSDPDAVATVYRRIGVDPAFRPRPTGVVNEAEARATALSDELGARLREYFAETDTALRSLLGKDLPWVT